jgi:CcmD family protein
MLLTILISILLQTDVQMAEGLRADGKFWVVIAVVSIVTIGILIYLFMLDKKVRKLEEK